MMIAVGEDALHVGALGEVGAIERTVQTVDLAGTETVVQIYAAVRIAEISAEDQILGKGIIDTKAGAGQTIIIAGEAVGRGLVAPLTKTLQPGPESAGAPHGAVLPLAQYLPQTGIRTIIGQEGVETVRKRLGCSFLGPV